MCTPMYTPMSREVYVRYPQSCTQQAASVHDFLIWLSAVFSTDPVLDVLDGIMTETGF